MPTDAAFGTLEMIDGRPALRFERQLRHPIDRAWRALTDKDELAHWFPQTVGGEIRPGGTLRYVDASMPDEPFEGEVQEMDEPTRLVFTWGEDALRFDLQPDGDGTRLTMLHLFDDASKAARDGAGWHACLDVLGLWLDGETPPWAPNERWAQVHPAYLERLGGGS